MKIIENESIIFLGFLSLLFSLSHICLLDFSILINWTSPFRILGVSGVRFHFYSILNRSSCKQTVKTLIRRRVLRRLIWVCTVCLGPKNGTQGSYGLINFELKRFSLYRRSLGQEKTWSARLCHQIFLNGRFVINVYFCWNAICLFYVLFIF